MHVYNRCVMAAFCGPWLLESNLLWMICIFFWNLYLDSTSKEGRRLRSAPPEGMHALHREREGHLFLGLQFPPCCWVRWVMISLLPLHFLEILNYHFCFVLMNCILGGLFDLDTHTPTPMPTRTRTHARVRMVCVCVRARARTHTHAPTRARTHTYDL